MFYRKSLSRTVVLIILVLQIFPLTHCKSQDEEDYEEEEEESGDEEEQSDNEEDYEEEDEVVSTSKKKSKNEDDSEEEKNKKGKEESEEISPMKPTREEISEEDEENGEDEEDDEEDEDNDASEKKSSENLTEKQTVEEDTSTTKAFSSSTEATTPSLENITPLEEEDEKSGASEAESSSENGYEDEDSENDDGEQETEDDENESQEQQYKHPERNKNQEVNIAISSKTGWNQQNESMEEHKGNDSLNLELGEYDNWSEVHKNFTLESDDQVLDYDREPLSQKHREESSRNEDSDTSQGGYRDFDTHPGNHSSESQENVAQSTENQSKEYESPTEEDHSISEEILEKKPIQQSSSDELDEDTDLLKITSHGGKYPGVNLTEGKTTTPMEGTAILVDDNFDGKIHSSQVTPPIKIEENFDIAIFTRPVEVGTTSQEGLEFEKKISSGLKFNQTFEANDTQRESKPTELPVTKSKTEENLKKEPVSNNESSIEAEENSQVLPEGRRPSLVGILNRRRFRPNGEDQQGASGENGQQITNGDGSRPFFRRRPGFRGGFRRRNRLRNRPKVTENDQNRTVVFEVDPSLQIKTDNRTEIKTLNQGRAEADLEVQNKTVIKGIVSTKFDENFEDYNNTARKINEEVGPTFKTSENRTIYTYTWNKTEGPEDENRNKSKNDFGTELPIVYVFRNVTRNYEDVLRFNETNDTQTIIEQRLLEERNRLDAEAEQRRIQNELRLIQERRRLQTESEERAREIELRLLEERRRAEIRLEEARRRENELRLMEEKRRAELEAEEVKKREKELKILEERRRIEAEAEEIRKREQELRLLEERKRVELEEEEARRKEAELRILEEKRKTEAEIEETRRRELILLAERRRIEAEAEEARRREAELRHLQEQKEAEERKKIEENRKIQEQKLLEERAKIDLETEMRRKENENRITEERRRLEEEEKTRRLEEELRLLQERKRLESEAEARRNEYNLRVEEERRKAEATTEESRKKINQLLLNVRTQLEEKEVENKENELKIMEERKRLESEEAKRKGFERKEILINETLTTDKKLAEDNDSKLLNQRGPDANKTKIKKKPANGTRTDQGKGKKPSGSRPDLKFIVGPTDELGIRNGSELFESERGKLDANNRKLDAANGSLFDNTGYEERGGYSFEGR